VRAEVLLEPVEQFAHARREVGSFDIAARYPLVRDQRRPS
jgi:hypothetical protein